MHDRLSLPQLKAETCYSTFSLKLIPIGRGNRRHSSVWPQWLSSGCLAPTLLPPGHLWVITVINSLTKVSGHVIMLDAAEQIAHLPKAGASWGVGCGSAHLR